MPYEVRQISPHQLVLNEINPRTIDAVELEQLTRSLTEFPEMLNLRPVVVDSFDTLVVLGGNMRVRAARTIDKLKTIPVVSAEDLTPEQQREFVIKDNLSFGRWDLETLATDENWAEQPLLDWGLDLEQETLREQVNLEIKSLIAESEISEGEQPYTRKIEVPTYEPKQTEKPNIDSLYDYTKTDALISEIDAALKQNKITKAEAHFLRAAAYRHTVFHYSQIAEYYAHSLQPVQELFENSALVIIDFEAAIEKGFVELTEAITEKYRNEHADKIAEETPEQIDEE